MHRPPSYRWIFSRRSRRPKRLYISSRFPYHRIKAACRAKQALLRCSSQLGHVGVRLGSNVKISADSRELAANPTHGGRGGMRTPSCPPRIARGPWSPRTSNDSWDSPFAGPQRDRFQLVERLDDLRGASRDAQAERAAEQNHDRRACVSGSERCHAVKDARAVRPPAAVLDFG